jgi:hypothetical protein
VNTVHPVHSIPEGALPSRELRRVPAFVYPLLFVAGALPLWPFVLRLPRALRFWVFVLPFLVLALPFVLPGNWLLLAPVMMGMNGMFAALFLVLQGPERENIAVRFGTPEYFTAGHRLRASVGITLCGLPFGLILVSMEQWLTDALWSVFYPVNASIDSISHEIVAAWVLFTLVFAFTAFYVSPALRPVTPVRILRLLMGTFLAYLIVHQLYLLLVAIPEWQTEIREIFPPWVIELRETFFHLLAYFAIPAVLGSGFYFVPGVGHSTSRSRRWREFMLGMVSTVLALGMAAWVSGMPIHYALLLGQQAEKSGRPTHAIPWYSRALTWSSSDKLKSYLQFRVGLLYRKTDRLDEARDAFMRVLVRYPHDETLLDDADEFKEKLAAGYATQGRRVVIPGIEARTEYKSAYCVPNSLGLLLNFWGDRTGAKRIGSEITQLDRGSLLTDEIYFAESRGFAALAVPLCTFDQVDRLIDAGIPVLAFIPGHVIAVFGYDEALGTLVTYDVSTFDIWTDARLNHFAPDWSQTYNTLGIVVPRNLLPKVRAVLGSDVETRSEAYVRYLLAAIDADPETRLKHLHQSLNHGFFPAGWEYRALSGDTAVAAGEDSAARAFLLAHETGDPSPYVFALDQLWRHHDVEAAEFLKDLGEQNPLSTPLVTALAAAAWRTGKPADATAVLLHSVSFENMDPSPAAFLLRHSGVNTGEGRAVGEDEDEGEWVSRLSLELLGRNELEGDEARLAYHTWRTLALRESSLDEALETIHGYLERWAPYDTTAIGDLQQALAHKSFRPNEEADQRVWKKQLRLLEARRARLQWATGG